MPEKHDNSNRAGAWLEVKKIASVNGELDGSKVYGFIVPTGKDGKAPSYELFLRDDNREGQAASFCPLFKPKAQVAEQIPNLKASGTIGWKGRLFWASLWLNNKSDNPNAPAMSLTFKHRDEPGGEPKSATEQTDAKAPSDSAFSDDAAGGDDLPF